MTAKRKHAKRVIARRASRDKTASEITVTIGALFDDLPDDPLQAAHALETDMKNALKRSEEMDWEQVRAFALKVYRSVWTHLMNSAAHSPAGGPRGPKLPAGVPFVSLLPHLVEAKQALASKKIPFEQWIREHRWPADMRPKSTTVYNWLARYGDLLYLYEPTNAKGERRTGF